MATATLRLYAELNDYLSPPQPRSSVVLSFDAPRSVGDLLQLCGVPFGAVELIVRAGESVGLDESVLDGDRLAVYPMFESFDIRPSLRVRRAPLRVIRFCADAHLGRLARALRMLGFDTCWANDIGDTALVARSLQEHRILLTRDRQLLKCRRLTHSCCVPAGDTAKQLEFLVQRLQLCGAIRPFRLCLVCNVEVSPLPDDAPMLTRVPPAVRRTADRYWYCRQCDRIYWRGSHWAAMQRRIRALCLDTD